MAYTNKPATLKVEQADRYNGGKPILSLVLEMPHAMVGVADVMAYGARKYARCNFKKGLPYTEMADSLLRHLSAWLNGEDIDPESGCRHADHIATNAMFLAELTYTRPEFDDRSRDGNANRVASSLDAIAQVPADPFTFTSG